MKIAAGDRFALPLGLLVLVFCSTGQAMECYQCKTWSSEQCTSKQTCASGEDTCMKVTQPDAGTSYYSCRTYATCNIAAVRTDLSLGSEVNLRVSCCQSNVCNKGFTGLPVSGLIFFLASTLLILFS